jgi:hypothetical protein
MAGSTTVVLWSQTAGTANVATAKAVVAERARLMVGGPGWKSARVPTTAVRVDSLQSALQLISATP